MEHGEILLVEKMTRRKSKKTGSCRLSGHSPTRAIGPPCTSIETGSGNLTKATDALN